VSLKKISIKKKIFAIGLALVIGFFALQEYDTVSIAQKQRRSNPVLVEPPVGGGPGGGSGGDVDVQVETDGPGVSITDTFSGDSFDIGTLDIIDIAEGIATEIGNEMGAEIANTISQATQEIVQVDQVLPSVANNADAVVADAVNETS